MSSEHRSRCSIVIPVWNRAELTQACLRELRRVETAVDFEVIVVDNGSSDETSEILSACAEHVLAIRNDDNLGFAIACNQGARFARGEFVVFLNNDTLPQSGWLDALVHAAEADARVGVVGSRLLYPDGRVQHAGVVFSRYGLVPYNLYRGASAELPATRTSRELRAVSGACMLVRRDCFLELGGFDEGFRNGFEDVDLCLRARQTGWRVVYEPRSELVHLEAQTSGRSEYDEANLRRFRARWADRLFPDEDWVMIGDGYASHIRQEGERSVHRVEPVRDPAALRAWRHLAAVQEALHQDGPWAAESFLEAPELWPDDPEALLWACDLCRRLALPEAEAAFKTRVAQLRPAATEPQRDATLQRALLALRTLI